MPNLNAVLNQEIRRLARKEIRNETAATRRAAAQHRRDLAEMKRTVASLQRRVNFLENQERRRVSQPETEVTEAESIRFSPKWLASHRNKLDLSAADYGRLVGVSGQSIYHWEQGKAKPRKSQLAALASVRGLGKRDALERLRLLEEK
jgi:DNA-binding transcriptional regulator YiaG